MWYKRIESRLPGRWRFRWRYWSRHTPWDTQVTPPEVMEFIGRTPPGRALDLGCGTGTNAVTLAKAGWRVTGVDFIPRAVRAARAKAARNGLAIDFRVGSVTDLAALSGPFDYALDIGCLHSLTGEDRARYAQNLARLLRPQAPYMLYARLPGGSPTGILPEEVEALLRADFASVRTVIGEEGGKPSAWYWFRRR